MPFRRMLTLAICLLWGSPAFAQSFGYVPQPTPQHSHAGEVGKFIETWKIPDHRNAEGKRVYSCCSGYDCEAVEMRQVNGRWYAFGHKMSPNAPVYFPEEKLEHNHLDARDCPSGQSFACINPARVPLCAIVCSGT